MARGFAKDGAVQEQIDTMIGDAVSQVVNRLPRGTSRTRCIECDHAIPAARQKALPGVQLCVGCQTEQDAQAKNHSSYNRRGSKDSQLR